MTMIKFPSIEQYRTAIKNVKGRASFVGRDDNGDAIYDKLKLAPTLKYRGTVKLHGTNAGIVYDILADTFQYQSRERILTLTSDNAGFALFMTSKEAKLREMIHRIYGFEQAKYPNIDKIILFGEWCGGSIQKGVALNQLDKMFVIFGIKLILPDDATRWVNLAEYASIELADDRIFNVLRFGAWEVDINFEKPELAQNEMIQITEAVEAECPAGKHFGVSGIGEGVVWQPIVPDWMSSDFWFKVKGEAHAMKSRVKTLAPVDIEKINSLNEFVDEYVSENRLKQGISHLEEHNIEVSIENLGTFIRWVFNDIVKEETDTIVANQLDPKKLGGPVANKARRWFIQHYSV